MSCRFLLAGFQVSLIGRFWVSPEAAEWNLEGNFSYSFDYIHRRPSGRRSQVDESLGGKQKTM